MFHHQRANLLRGSQSRDILKQVSNGLHTIQVVPRAKITELIKQTSDAQGFKQVALLVPACVWPCRLLLCKSCDSASCAYSKCTVSGVIPCGELRRMCSFVWCRPSHGLHATFRAVNDWHGLRHVIQLHGPARDCAPLRFQVAHVE